MNTAESSSGLQDTSRTSTVRVLVADDDESIRETLRVVLEDVGYVVCEAADGVETLDALSMSQEPLVVLLDAIMPRISGYEVLLRVAQNAELLARHAYIVCTAEQISSRRIGPHFAEFIERYGFSVLTKPFDIDDLLATVWQQTRRLMTGPSETGRERQDGETA